MSTPGKRLNGSTASFTLTWSGTGVVGRHDALVAQLGERRADEQARRGRRHRNAGRLRDERQGPRRSRVRLEHEDVAVLHGELHVARPDDAEGVRDGDRPAATIVA